MEWLTRATLMFRKNKYATSHSSCQHRTTAQSSFCSDPLRPTSAATGGHLCHMVWSKARSHLSLQQSREARCQRLAGRTLPSPPSALQQHRSCHQLCTKVSICPCTVANRLSTWYLSRSGQDAAMACFLTSWEAPPRSSPLLMSPGLLWWWVSSCTAPDRTQIPKTVGTSYSPLSCKLSSGLQWSTYVWLLECSVQSCSWFGSLCLSEIQKKKTRTFTSENWIQVSITHLKISEEVKTDKTLLLQGLINEVSFKKILLYKTQTNSDIWPFCAKLICYKC